MKNLTKLIGIIALAAVIGFSLTGCPPEPDPVHEHDYAWTVTRAATCIATGVETGICKIDSSHTTTREIPIDLVDGHDWDFDNVTNETTAPTCTTKGSGTLNCKRVNCNETNTSTDNIPALGHDYQNWTQTTVPTCTTAGVETGTCTRDQVTTTRQKAIDPNAHDWDTDTGLCNNNCGALYYSLGDTGPGGGKIFYRIATGFTVEMVNPAQNYTAHYREAAPADMTTTLTWASSAFISSDPLYGGTGDWTEITGTTERIGTGRKNTAVILATDADAPAAKACNDYSNNGKTDWFLPSINELNQLYANKTSVGNMGTSNYWSSSQQSIYHAWNRDFSSASQVESTGGKNYIYSVRAVRAF
jgi:hypothetical protein